MGTSTLPAYGFFKLHPAGAAKVNMNMNMNLNIFGHVSMCFGASRIMSARQITQSWVQSLKTFLMGGF